MRTLFVCILACLLLAGGALAEPAPLPEVGENVAGFVVQSIEEVGMLGATRVLFEHEKTGAELAYFANSDTNRSFDISFRTPALDDKGKPHVFEHITISGSQKYPDANLFMPFMNQTYSTFVNAATYSNMTSFPVASLSEEQLMTMMDYYLSGVFEPLLYTEPKLVEREAWRYEMTDRDGPITIAGTVYSEMQGALTVESQALSNAVNALFENGAVAHESGGIPEYVRTLTYEELVAFHDAYYHPSNALIVLYGDLDYRQFMEHIDREYLSKYEKKDIYVERGTVTPYTQTRYVTYDAPVEATAATQDASYIAYSFAANGADIEDTLGLMLIANVLNTESLPYMRLARERMPGVNVSVSVDVNAPVPCVYFFANGVNEDDRDTFVSVVDDALSEIAQNGIPESELESLIAMQKLSMLLTPENQNLGVMSSMNIAMLWAGFDTVDYFSIYSDILDRADTALLNRLTDTYFTNNTHRAVAVTRPVAGLTEENAQKLETELAELKSSMTDAELDALVQNTQAFADWAAQPADTAILEKLLPVTVENLPEEVAHFDTVEETKDGVRYMTAEADAGDVGQTSIMLDGATIPTDMLKDAQLYLYLMGKLDTAAHTKEELDSLIQRYLAGFGASLSAENGYNGVADRYAAFISWIGLGQDYADSVALAKELFFDTQLTDTAAIRDIMSRQRTNLRTSFDANPLNTQMQRCIATFSDTAAYSASVGGVASYDYLQEMIDLADTAPDQLTARLENARDLLNNRHNAVVLFAGGADACEMFDAHITDFFGDMPDIARDAVDYSSLRLDITREAFIVNSTVQMNLISHAADGYTGVETPIVSYVNDMYMLPKLRNALGAYGAYIAYTTDYMHLYTYRDPNLAGTYEIFEQLPEYLRTVELDQATVDRYIIGSYAGISRPLGALTGALTALSDKLIGLDEETRLGWQRAAKATTVEDVRAFAERMQTLVDEGVRSTSCTESTYQENQKLFDSVVRTDETAAADEAA